MLSIPGFNYVREALAAPFGKRPSVTPLVFRGSSFPFISGDTFRSLAESVWEAPGFISRQHGIPGTFFIEVDVVNREPLERLGEEIAKLDSPPVVIIHNGDKELSSEKLSALSALCESVYCVNLVSEIEGVIALPIGLENLWRNRNGRLDLFYPDLQNLDQPSRNRVVTGSFAIHTNPEVRKPLAQMMRVSRHGFLGKTRDLESFRSVLRDSMFVICPPGNGTDTHRTWESIYSGAVPVVLKGSLASSLVESLPILEVDNYQDFLSLSDGDLRSIFHVKKHQSRDKAFAPYWVKELRGLR